MGDADVARRDSGFVLIGITYSASTTGQDISGLGALGRLANYQEIIRLSIKPRESGRPPSAFDNHLETVKEDVLPLEDLPGKIELSIRQSYA